MDVDLRKYRLADDEHGAWIDKTIKAMGYDEYRQFRDRVWNACKVLKPGKFYDVRDIPEDKQELFIKICCIYIQTHPEVVFSDDYSRLEKEEPIVFTKKSCIATKGEDPHKPIKR